MGKPRGIRTARKMRTRRREQRWADLGYKKVTYGFFYSHLERFYDVIGLKNVIRNNSSPKILIKMSHRRSKRDDFRVKKLKY